jgi:hypothetical protein
MPFKVIVGKTTLGQSRTQSQLFDSHRKRCPLVLPPWLMCVVLSGYFPCKVYIDLILYNTLGFVLPLYAKHRMLICHDPKATKLDMQRLQK